MSGFLPICSRFCPVLPSTWSCECAPLIGLKESGQFLFNGKKHKLTILAVGWIDPLQKFLGTNVASHQFRSHWTTIKELKNACQTVVVYGDIYGALVGAKHKEELQDKIWHIDKYATPVNIESIIDLGIFCVNLQYMHILLFSPTNHILVPLLTFRWAFLARPQWGILWAICLEAA